MRPEPEGTPIEQAVRLAIENNADMVERWLADTPKSWGYLAGKAVGACRRELGRELTDRERRLVWSRLWQRLTELRQARARDL
ncbi:MAG: hypothetical protein HY330_06255 [Chloroflexi bacterium]|nr:hypothetical protein [Chloroflexota bacterium]